ncbi:MAG: hypothetical protein ACF8PN_02005 [Phycisphaerales bacterium]
MMTRDELIEAAALDAIGLLEADELARFEAALQDAAPDVRAAVREAQTGVAGAFAETTPEAIPSPTLRQRVTAAVARAMDRSAPVRTLEPVATVPDDGPRWSERSISIGHVSPLWRIAALVFFASSLAFGLVAYNTHVQSLQLVEKYFIPSETQKLVEQRFGRSVADIILDPAVVFVQLHASGDDENTRGLITFFAEDGQGVLILDGLPEEVQHLELLVTLPGEEEQTLGQFERPHEGSTAVDFKLAAATVTGAAWRVRGLTDGGESFDLLVTRA